MQDQLKLIDSSRAVTHSRWAIVVHAIAMQIVNNNVLIVPGFEGTHRGTDLYEVYSGLETKEDQD